MDDLSGRKIKILKAVVEEYIDTAEPVGSEKIEKKYQLGISPATIRNEMVELTDLGYLSQPHTSAGRIPTSISLKFYINELMEEKQLSVADEVAAKERIWDYRFEFERMMRETTRALAERTGAIAIAEINGDVYSAGYANILDMPEFYDIDVAKNVLGLLDEVKYLQSIFDHAFGDEPIHVLLGEDLGQEYLIPCGLVFIHFQAGSRKGTLGVIGSSRLDYSVVIPNLKCFNNLISEVGKNW